MKKFFIFFIILLCSNNIFAEACPTPEEIKSNHFHEWKPFTRDNGTPASPEAINVFIHEIVKFGLAEFMPDAPEGPAHCYYYGQSNRHLALYLVKNHLHANPNNPYWIIEPNHIMQCYTSEHECDFIF